MIHLLLPLESEGLSIYSTNLYQGVNILVFGNQSIARIARAGGCLEAETDLVNVPDSLIPQFLSVK